jgi:hypothetical protein
MKKLILLVVMAMTLSVGGVAFAADRGPEPVRVATFNASLNRFNAGDLGTELAAVAGGGAPGAQLGAVLDIIAINDPDILLINEFDYQSGNGALMAQITGYPYSFEAPSNTGVPSGVDLDGSGSVGGPNDAFGFGFFPGQFGMLVLSKYEIVDVRTFQNFLWKDMPGALLPTNPDGSSFYSDEALDIFRLSSKSHWDVTIDVGARGLHFLVSHPTPPVFDGPEDRNGTRNFDEIRFWADYISPSTSGYIYDDDGVYGGLTPGSAFVIAGDQNSDPLDGDSIPGAAQQLLESPRVNAEVTPSSEGAVQQAELQGGINDDHLGDPAFDTADFSDSTPGNLRADYVLPSKQLRLVDAGVFWPLADDPSFSLVGVFPFPSSDHRLVWIDVTVPGRG